jgi:hypothetical protein
MEGDIIPELGDLLTIVSDLYGKTTGRIVYRDGRLIRVKPYQSSDRAIEFPLDEGTGLFKDAVGVSEIILHSKRRSAYYSKQLAVVPGTVLEFYTFDSKVAAEKGVVKSVVASGPNDYIELEDGRKLEFNFVGPPEPISVILPRAPDVSPENEAGVNTNNESGLAEGAINGLDEDVVIDPDTILAKTEDIEGLDQSILPSSELEIIPVSELRYNDVVQLEDMNNDLISGLSIKMQKNRKIKRALKNQAKSFLDLKNAIYNDGNGFLDYAPETLLETIKKQALYFHDRPLDYIIPISNMRRTIFIDDDSFESQQLIGKNEVSVFVNSINAAKAFDSTSSSGAGASNKFATYMNTIFMNNNGISSGAGEKSLNAKQTIIAQSVLRAPFPKQPQGLVRNLPSGRKAGTFGGAQKASDTKLNLNFIGKVNHTMYRVLPTMTVTHPKTKYSVHG